MDAPQKPGVESALLVQGEIPETGQRVALPMVQDPGTRERALAVRDVTKARGVQRLGSASLGASATAVFTATKKYRNVKVVLTSVDDSGAIEVWLYHVPAGGTAGIANALALVEFAAKAAPLQIENLGLGPGESIQGTVKTGDATDATATVYGEEIL